MLKYTADLTPQNLDPAASPNVLFRPLYANDIIYGGWGQDAIHGGAGDDAISGAEAPALSYTNNYDQAGAKTASAVQSDFAHPLNPGNVLGYNPTTTLFGLYDPNDTLRKILLTATGGLSKTGSGLEWILNFNDAEGPLDTRWIVGQNTYPAVPTDGEAASEIWRRVLMGTDSSLPKPWDGCGGAFHRRRAAGCVPRPSAAPVAC